MAFTKADHTITVGVDELGKHYKYESGAGRGRKPLNLSPAQAKALAAKGLKPNSTVQLSIADAQRIGVAGGPAGPGRGNRTGVTTGTNFAVGKVPQGPDQANPVLDIQADAMADSQRRWVATGAYKTKEGRYKRLTHILNDRNLAWLENAGPNPSQAHRALAAAVLATVFGMTVNPRSAKTGFPISKGDKSKPGFRVKFSPFLDSGNKHGQLELVDKDGAVRASWSFKGLKELRDNHLKREQMHAQFHAMKKMHEPPPAGPQRDLYATLSGHLAQAKHIPQATRKEFHDSMMQVVNAMPAIAAGHINSHLKDVSWNADKHAVLASMKQYSPNPEALDQQVADLTAKYGVDCTPVGGYNKGAGRIYLDSEGEALTRHEVYAHELAHSLGYATNLHASPEWVEAYHSEAKSLGEYAAHSAVEAFAEFGRFVYGRQVPSEALTSLFPKMGKVWKDAGLLPDREIAGTKTPKMPEVFEKPVVAGGDTADSPKVQSSGVNTPMWKSSTRRVDGDSAEGITSVVKQMVGDGKTVPHHPQSGLPAEPPHLTEFHEAMKKHEAPAPAPAPAPAKPKGKAWAGGTINVTALRKVSNMHDEAYGKLKQAKHPVYQAFRKYVEGYKAGKKGHHVMPRSMAATFISAHAKNPSLTAEQLYKQVAKEPTGEDFTGAGSLAQRVHTREFEGDVPNEAFEHNGHTVSMQSGFDRAAFELKKFRNTLPANPEGWSSHQSSTLNRKLQALLAHAGIQPPKGNIDTGSTAENKRIRSKEEKDYGKKVQQIWAHAEAVHAKVKKVTGRLVGLGHQVTIDPTYFRGESK